MILIFTLDEGSVVPYPKSSGQSWGFNLIREHVFADVLTLSKKAKLKLEMKTNSCLPLVGFFLLSVFIQQSHRLY